MDKPPAVFVSPHSDDLLLSMSSSIVNHLNVGRYCIFVLMTTGVSGWVVDEISKRAKREVTMFDAVSSRITEFNAETEVYSSFGPAHRQVNNFTDGKLTYDEVRTTILNIEQAYPGADFKVMSDKDSHPDHSICGTVARDLQKSGLIIPARYYLKRGDVESGRGKGTGYWSDVAVNAGKPYVTKAINEYKLWSPAQGRYAVGYTSVGSSFDALSRDMRSFVHA